MCLIFIALFDAHRICTTNTKLARDKLHLNYTTSQAIRKNLKKNPSPHNKIALSVDFKHR